MIGVLSLCLLLAAEPVAEKPPAAQVQPECQACTARHKALQRLQNARKTPPAGTGTEDEKSAEE